MLHIVDSYASTHHCLQVLSKNNTVHLSRFEQTGHKGHVVMLCLVLLWLYGCLLGKEQRLPDFVRLN